VVLRNDVKFGASCLCQRNRLYEQQKCTNKWELFLVETFCQSSNCSMQLRSCLKPGCSRWRMAFTGSWILLRSMRL